MGLGRGIYHAPCFKIASDPVDSVINFIIEIFVHAETVFQAAVLDQLRLIEGFCISWD